MRTKLTRNGNIIEIDKKGNYNKLRSVDEVHHKKQFHKYRPLINKPESEVDLKFLTEFRKELHLAIIAQKLIKAKIANDSLPKLFEVINQFLYHKFGIGLINKLTKEDIIRQEDVQNKIEQNAFVYTGISSLKEKVQKCQSMIT